MSFSAFQLKSHVKISLWIWIFLTFTACSTAYVQKPQPVNHVVLLWFSEAAGEDYFEEVRSKAEHLKNIPGIQALIIGLAITSDRPIVDDSFHLGLLFQFDSKEAMNRYLNHPAHEQFVEHYIKGKINKLIVYDF